MATEFNYTREWTDAEAFPLLSFTKNWENPEDYPTYEPDEMQVRRDMQSLHDEVKDFLNNELIPRVIAEDATVEGWEAQETARSEAESARSEAETARADAEQGRVDAEAARVQTEAARVETEAARATAESARVTAETGRVEAEAARVTAEQNRATVESARVTAEAARAAAESARVTTEANRESAESGRAAAESARATAEAARADAEAKRVSAEQARVSAEKARADAESARTSEFATLKTNVEAATNSANTAVGKVNKMTVSATDLTPGSAATVTKGTNSNGGIDLKFGIPEGAQGKTGNGIKSINKTGGTGAAGTYDTYTITMTDGSTFNFRVLNGANGKDGDGTGDMVADTYDPQGKRTDIFAYVEEHGGVQSDWSQNDANDNGYIKNRTHWTEVAVKLAFAEQSVESGVNLIEHDASLINVEPVEGNTYIITVDGVSYQCVMYIHPRWDSHFLGDDAIVGGSAHPEDVPFAIESYSNWEGENLEWQWYVTFADGSAHTVKIEYESTDELVYHQLDERFLPDSVKAQPDWNQNDETASDYVKNRPGGYYENVYSTVFEEATLDFTFYEKTNQYAAWLAGDFVFNLVDSGTVVKVIFDGVEYVKTFDDDFGFDPDDTIPFGFKINGGEPFGLQIHTTIEGDTHTVEISKAEQSPIVIPEEFLPDTVATKADIEAAIGSAIGGSY